MLKKNIWWKQKKLEFKLKIKERKVQRKRMQSANKVFL